MNVVILQVFGCFLAHHMVVKYIPIELVVIRLVYINYSV